jgi:putative acetyltransferase
VTTVGEIAVDDPRKPEVRALLERHLTFCLSETPPEHSFALDVDALVQPGIAFFSYRDSDGTVLAVGAIKELDAAHAELKSMHTAAEARGRGIGRAMLGHLLSVARSRGCQRVSLETGTTPGFAAARAIYESAGFVPAEPFADYVRTEDNTFYTLTLQVEDLGHCLSVRAERGQEHAAGPVRAAPTWSGVAAAGRMRHTNAMSETPVVTCVLLWARPGMEAALSAYEDKVLGLIPEHGGRVLERGTVLPGSRHDGEPPTEVQFLMMPSEASLDAYMNDPRRLAMAAERDASVARTDLFRIQPVSRPEPEH